MALQFAFGELKLSEVLSFTARLNERSQRLMHRLGMMRSLSEDFEHPKVPVGHTLRDHVLYRIQNTPAVLERLNRELMESAQI